MVHAGHDEVGHDAGEKGHGHGTRGGAEEDEDAGDGGADVVAERAEHGKAEDHGEAHGERAHKHRAQHAGDDLVEALLDVVGGQRDEQGRQELLLVLDELELDAEEVDGALVGHEGHEGRGEHGGGAGHGVDRGGAELNRGAPGHEDGHEVERGVGDPAEDGVGARLEERGPRVADEQQDDLEHAAADEAGHERGHRGGDVADDGVEHALGRQGLLALSGGRGVRGGLAVLGGLEHGHGLLVDADDVSAEDDLLLAGGVDDAEDAVDLLDGGLVGGVVVHEDEAQARGAVGNVGDVGHAAGRGDDLLGNALLVHCQSFLPWSGVRGWPAGASC